jgi:TolB-like protein/class 3 adenylate cyclase/Tfp pilus assembly protein PilF
MQERRLAAIMFTDIVGYTALMQQNEALGIQTRTKHRQIFNEVTEKKKKKILQYYGDGTLSIFSSAVDAVECGITMQMEFQKEPKVPVRIGIHVGDVVFSEEEIIGDGVNITSRIESIAFPGSVFISEKVFDEIKNHPKIKAISLGHFSLKNVEKPIKIYAISNEGLIVPRPEDIESKAAKSRMSGYPRRATRKSAIIVRFSIAITIATIIVALLYIFFKSGTIKNSSTSELEKSIAVLPLDYLSEDQSKQYIAEGVLDAITGHLSTIEGLRVMPRTSVEQYRGTTKTIEDIGKELDVSYLIEGNFLIVEDQVSITIQLVTAKTNDHVYYNEYRRDYKDIIAVQSEVARTIANEIEVAISPQTLKRIEKIPTNNLQAYDLYLRGRDAFHRFYLNRNNADLENCIELFEQAIQSDSSFALPYAWLGRAIEYEIGERVYFNSKENTILSLLNKALSLEPNLTDGYWIRGRYYRNTGELEKAIDDLRMAIEINPSNALAYRYLGTIYFIKREYTNELTNLKKAEKLERGNELTQLFSDIAQVYISVGDFENGENYFEASIRLQPNFIEGYQNLIWAEIRQGKFEDAHKYASRLLTLYPDQIASNGIMAEALSNLGRYEEAEHYYRKWLSKSSELGEDRIFNRHRFALILWMNGKKEEAVSLFGKHMEICKSSIESGGLYGKSLAAYDLAGMHAFLGDKNEAYRWLRKYEQDGFIWGYHQYILIDPLFENLRQDPAFKTIMQDVQKEKSSIRKEIQDMEELEPIQVIFN